MRRFLLLALLALCFVGAVTACGGGEEVSPVAEDPPAATTGGETETEETDSQETETEDETETGGELAGNAEAGAEVWNANGCGGCHVLEEANSEGAVGPNLDESKPDAELVVDRVTNGQGVMPAFGDQLDEQQILDVAAYVVESTS